MKAFLEKIYFIMVFGELTTAIPRLFGPTESDSSAVHESDPVLLCFNLIFIGVTCYYIFPKLPLFWKAILRLRWTFLLYCWALASTLWSVSRLDTLRFGFYASLYLAASAYFAWLYDIDRLLDLLNRCLLTVAVLSVAGEYLLSPLTDPAPGWSGIFLQKNVLGLCMMLGIAVLLAQGKRWNFKRVSILLFYLLLLALSQSFTSILTTATVMLFVVSKKLAGWSRAILWSFLLGAAALSMIVSNPLDLLLDAGGKSSNLTGRDVIWVFALKASVERPFTGHGFGGAYWTFSSDTAKQALHWNPHHAHNGFLEIRLDIGIVGLVLLSGFLINSWKRSRRIERYDLSLSALWMQVLILAALAHNLTESDFLTSNISWFLITMSTFACLRLEDQARPRTLSDRLVAPESIMASTG